MKIYLASSSPRRREILQNLGVDFEILAQNADENVNESDPCRLTELLARRKAEAAASVKNDGLIIGCDTVVFAGGEILGKPRNEDDARRMLCALSGKTHEVISGICLILAGKTVTAHEITKVKFSEMSADEIELCIKKGEPLDKAGAYAVQGMASLYIEGIDGDYFNVVGLPVRRLYEMLKTEFSVSLVPNDL